MSSYSYRESDAFKSVISEEDDETSITSLGSIDNSVDASIDSNGPFAASSPRRRETGSIKLPDNSWVELDNGRVSHVDALRLPLSLLEEDPQFKHPGDNGYEATLLASGEVSVLSRVRRRPSTFADDEDEPAGHGTAGSTSRVPVYGHPVSSEAAAALFGPPCHGAPTGLLWYAQILPDARVAARSRRAKKILARCLAPDGTPKVRRASPMPVRRADFLSSLVRTADGRWIFSGVLNGWPALTLLEVRAVTVRRVTVASGMGIAARRKIVRVWEAGAGGDGPPVIPDNEPEVRITLRQPRWSQTGFGPTCPGCMFWYQQTRPVPRVLYGTRSVEGAREDASQASRPVPQCTHVHMYNHRYALGTKSDGTQHQESFKDLNTYHTLVFLEWDHGEHGTVVEMGLRNGVGGAGARSNWCEDRNEPVPELYRLLPRRMVAPWIMDRAELRCTDVPMRNADELLVYLRKYAGSTNRFLNPELTMSSEVRLTFRGQDHIAQYVCNYARRDPSYSEVWKNCQTFACDLYSFLAGKKKIEPYHALNRANYINRSYWFLYDADKYEKK